MGTASCSPILYAKCVWLRRTICRGISTSRPTMSTVHCDYVGGGFGSKFAPDYWSITAAKISQEIGRPVKLMLTATRNQKIAGNRPSGYIKVSLGADDDGVVQVWDSALGNRGTEGSGVSHSQIPYVYIPQNYRRTRPASAPTSPRPVPRELPIIRRAAPFANRLDDLARKMNADSLEIFRANIKPATSNLPSASEIYLEEMEVAAKLMDWKAKWHPHGKGSSWGNRRRLGHGHPYLGRRRPRINCKLKIHPGRIGGVILRVARSGHWNTHSLRQMSLPKRFGLQVKDVKVNIGSSKYPNSGASGGSTTVGASANRIAVPHRTRSRNSSRSRPRNSG